MITLGWTHTPNDHYDIDQHYDGLYFWTRCSCGLEFAGTDPDDADSHQMAHLHDDTELLAQYAAEQTRSWK